MFRSGKILEAIPELEAEIFGGDISKDSYNYLGLAYFQGGDYDKAIEVFEQGTRHPISDVGQLYFNEGNVAFVKGDYLLAESCFSLSVAASPQMYSALLNRANARLMLEKYELSLKDYKDYIAACPEDTQAEKIRALIIYIEERIAFEATERRMLAEEYAAFERENRRASEESAREAVERTIEEEKRQRKILDDMLNSLRQADVVDDNSDENADLNYERIEELPKSMGQDDTDYKEENSDFGEALDYEQVVEGELNGGLPEKIKLNYERVEETPGSLRQTDKGLDNDLATEDEADYERVMEGELGNEDAENLKAGEELRLDYERIIEVE